MCIASHGRCRCSVTPARALGVWLALAVLALSANGLRAQQPKGEVASHECCLELLLPIGARTVATGGTMDARATLDGAFGNPASLAPMDSGAFVIHHLTGSVAQTDGFSLFLTPHHLGTFGLSYLLVDYGDIPSTDATGLQIGSISTRAHMIIGSYATTVGSQLRAGLNYSIYLFRVQCTGQCAGNAVSASTQTVDVGLRYDPAPVPGLELGIAAVHLGLPLQINNALQADPAPARLHVGAAYDVLRHLHADSTLALWVSGEVVARWSSPGAFTPAFGAEFSAANAVFLRAGYAGGSGIGSGPSVGVGLNYERFKIGLAKSFTPSSFQPDQTPFQVTFAIRF